MPIKLDNLIPYDVDVSNPDDLKSFLVTVKQAVEEIADKAQELQLSVRTTVPGTDDLDEGEFVRVTDVNEYIYTKKDGNIRKWQITA